MINLIFVHGWSVTNTNTYRDFPEVLSNAADNYGLDINIKHIHLGRYISFHDEVTMGDIVRAFDQALRDTLSADGKSIPPFSCITHSTGGPVVREWVARFYSHNKGTDDLPLRHLIMLAPANHGSALAALGKKRVGRIKSWFQGIEPGQRVLDWLCLGSDEQWRLNLSQLRNPIKRKDFFPFVFAGQSIDRQFYDFMNCYLTESGSDGVIRVCATSLNFALATLVQSDDLVTRRRKTYRLKLKNPVEKVEQTPLAVVPGAAHSGKTMGIMNSVTVDSAPRKPIVDQILKCLAVESTEGYLSRGQEMAEMAQKTQAGSPRFMMIVFQIRDDSGEIIKDYDLLVLSGKRYEPSKLPKGFLLDKQLNEKTGKLVFYLNANLLKTVSEIGFRVVARPNKGFVHYAPAEFFSKDIPVSEFILENGTLYVDIVLKRLTAKNTFRLGPADVGPVNFKNEKPSDEFVE